MNTLGLQAAVVLPTLADLSCLPLPCAFGAADASDSIGGGEQKKNANTYPSTESGEVQGTHWGTGRSATRDLPGAGAEHIPHPPAGCEELLVRRLLAHDSVLEHTGLAWVPTELDKVGVSWCRSGSAH